MRAPLFLFLLLFLFAGCSGKTRDEKLLECSCEELSIRYEPAGGFFIIGKDETADTIGLAENWIMALYRYKQCRREIPAAMTYDQFTRSEQFFLPGGDVFFKAMNQDPAAVFGSGDAPTFCDCMDAQGNYDMGNPNCEKKFQVYRTGFSDSVSWYYAYHRDICTGLTSDTVSYAAYRDSTLERGKRAAALARLRQHILDSIDNSGPMRTCSGQDFVPAYRRSSGYRMYEPCRSKTGHSSGRCRRHR